MHYGKDGSCGEYGNEFGRGQVIGGFGGITRYIFGGVGISRGQSYGVGSIGVGGDDLLCNGSVR